MFGCKHEWKMLSETVTQSKMEHAIGLLGNASGKIKLPPQLCCADRFYIQVFTCNKCGKIRRYVAEI